MTLSSSIISSYHKRSFFSSLLDISVSQYVSRPHDILAQDIQIFHAYAERGLTRGIIW